jgi:response regulator of citrate/malate metabolism
MSIADLFTNVDQKDDDLRQKVVEKLINNEDLESKTELNKPLRWSCLETIQNFIEKKDMSITANILKNFMNTSFTYLISNERKGRKEYIEALNALSATMNKKADSNLSDKLGLN